MPIQSFPTRNPKLEFPEWKKTIIAEATRRGLKGFVLSEIEYAQSVGQKPGDVFRPITKPTLPSDEAKSAAWTKFNILNTAYEEKQEKPLLEFTVSFVAALGPAEIAIIGGGSSGTLNKTLLEMITILSAHYEKWSPKELKTLKETLHNGTISINIDEPIDSYLTKVCSIHEVATKNHSPIPEHEKIEYVSSELRKLNIAQLNLWLMTYDNSTPEVEDKKFDEFSKQLKTLFRSLDKDTMSTAGYAAQAKQQYHEDQNEVMAQLARLEKKIDATSTQNKTQGKQQYERRGAVSERRPFFYCHSCKFQKSHWSAECSKPLPGHDSNKNHPNA